MGKNSKKNVAVQVQPEAPKRRGRPASFTVATKAFLVHLPFDTISHVKEMSEVRGERINQTVARIIESAYNQSAKRRQGRQGTTEAATVEAPAA